MAFKNEKCGFSGGREGGSGEMAVPSQFKKRVFLFQGVLNQFKKCRFLFQASSKRGCFCSRIGKQKEGYLTPPKGEKARQKRFMSVQRFRIAINIYGKNPVKKTLIHFSAA